MTVSNTTVTKHNIGYWFSLVQLCIAAQVNDWW